MILSSCLRSCANYNYAYAFDHIGNRATETVAMANSESRISNYSTNPLNQYTEINTENTENAEEGNSVDSVFSVFNPSYDEDGNVTQVQTSTGTWTIEYNAENRPVRFENAETQTVVECAYDSQGRRFEKKVTVAGATTLHHRYIYRGYLQIAALDLTRSAHPALWLVTWDPSQPTATRPLAIQKDGTWFTYGYDITKNVCEVFGPAGYIRTSYSYAPFGAITESGDVSQPFQWSSEHYDSELDLVYYNFRHYSPALGRFLSRDPIAEQGGFNLYAFVKNNPIQKWDRLGRFAPIPGCHLNSPTCGGNGTIFQPVDISIQPGGYLDAFSLFLEWLSGVHQNPTVEEINSPRSMELSQSDGGRYFVDFVKRKYNGVHCDKWDLTDDFDYNFRDPYRFVVNLPYGIAHFVGSFQDGVSTVYSRDVKNCKITMLFSVDNYSTWESFLYGATTFFDDSQSLGKTWKQTYRWTETFYCCNS